MDQRGKVIPGPKLCLNGALITVFAWTTPSPVPRSLGLLSAPFAAMLGPWARNSPSATTGGTGTHHHQHHKLLTDAEKHPYVSGPLTLGVASRLLGDNSLGADSSSSGDVAGGTWFPLLLETSLGPVTSSGKSSRPLVASLTTSVGSESRKMGFFALDPFLFDRNVTVTLQRPAPMSGLNSGGRYHSTGSSSGPGRADVKGGLQARAGSEFDPVSVTSSGVASVAGLEPWKEIGSVGLKSNEIFGSHNHSLSTTSSSSLSKDQSPIPQVQLCVNARPVFVASQGLPDLSAFSQHIEAVTLEFAFTQYGQAEPRIVAQLPASAFWSVSLSLCSNVYLPLFSYYVVLGLAHLLFA